MVTKRNLAAWLEETRICAFRAKLELLYPATDGDPGPEVRVVDVDSFIDGVAATCAIFRGLRESRRSIPRRAGPRRPTRQAVLELA
jgi:hypothetical protein